VDVVSVVLDELLELVCTRPYPASS
jgi:hypothetical protein